MGTATLTVRLPEEEKRLIGEYAKTFGTSVSDLVRRYTMERIEDNIDAQDYLEAMREDDGTRYSMEEMMEAARTED